MVIVQINAVNGILSTGATCEELAEYLNSKGHSCYTLYANGIKTNSYSIKIADKFDCKFHALMSRLTGLQGYYSYYTTFKIIKLMKQIKPDIIHLRNLHSNFINLRMLFNFIEGHSIPTVVTLHDCWFFTGKCTYYSSMGCNKWMSGCHHCPQLKSDNRSEFFDFTNKMWNDKKNWFASINKLAIVGVSDWVTNEASKSFLGEYALICKRIYNWIDFNIFSPQKIDKIRDKLGLGTKHVILGVASFWEERKGFDKFLAMANAIPDDCVIILVGNIPSMDIPSNIINVPLTMDRNSLAEMYSLADVFIQMSSEETFGKVVAESLACGTPVITNKSTANPELVRDGCGYVVDSLEETIIAINKILSNGKKYYSESCCKYAAENFSMENNAAEYLRIYEELVGNGRTYDGTQGVDLK